MIKDYFVKNNKQKTILYAKVKISTWLCPAIAYLKA